MPSSNCCTSKPRTASGIFLKKMPPMTLPVRASELEELH